MLDALKPTESPHFTNPLPEAYHTSHSADQAYAEAYFPPRRNENYPENVPASQQYAIHQGPIHEISLAGEKGQEAEEKDGAQSDKRFCGLSKKLFIIIMTIAILIVAAVVGWTVGGILGTKKKSPAGDDGIASPSDPVPSSAAPDPTPNGTTTVVTTAVAPRSDANDSHNTRRGYHLQLLAGCDRRFMDARLL
jgi:hypothetical protein